MAVYQGARRRPAADLGLRLDGVLARLGPSAAIDAATAPAERRRGRATATAARRPAAGATAARRRRPSAVALAVGAIVIAFSAAFLSLSQSVRVAATGYDIVRLVSERDQLDAIRQDLRSDVDRLRSEPAIRKQALDAGLGQLGAPLVIQAR